MYSVDLGKDDIVLYRCSVCKYITANKARILRHYRVAHQQNNQKIDSF